MNSFYLKTFFLFYLLSLNSFAEKPYAKVTKVTGEVYVAKVLKRKALAYVGDLLHPRDKIKTGSDSSIEWLTLSGNNKVTVGPNTYRRVDSPDKITLNLFDGKLPLNLKENLNDKKFTIKPPTVILGPTEEQLLNKLNYFPKITHHELKETEFEISGKWTTPYRIEKFYSIDLIIERESDQSYKVTFMFTRPLRGTGTPVQAKLNGTELKFQRSLYGDRLYVEFPFVDQSYSLQKYKGKEVLVSDLFYKFLGQENSIDQHERLFFYRQPKRNSD